MSTLLEVQALDGLVRVDIAASLPADGSPAIAVEFDGPTHSLRAPLDGPSAELAAAAPLCGPQDGRTRLRGRLLRRSGAFAGLVVVPFFEWDACGGDPARQEAYLAGNLRAEGLAWALPVPMRAAP